MTHEKEGFSVSENQAGLIYRYQVAQVLEETLGPMVEVSVHVRRADRKSDMWRFLLEPKDATEIGAAIYDAGKKVQAPPH